MTEFASVPTDVTRRWLIRTSIAILVSIVLFAALAFVLLRYDEDDAEIIGAARVTWDAATDNPLGEGKAASVEVIEEDGEHRVYVFDIEVLRPPADFEFIEVWLVDGADGSIRMSVGSFDEIRTRLFELPDDVDPLDFDRVEFSLEPDDGDADFSGQTLMTGDMVWLAEPDE